MTLAIKCTACIAQLCTVSASLATEDPLFEEHHAHEHGVATLDVAVDGSQLLLQFRSPAMNLLGFERAPRTAQDEAAVAKAVQMLRDPATQFAPSSEARCQVKKTEVATPDWSESHEHFEFAAEYTFHCERPELLQQLHIRLLEALEEDVKVEVQVASAQGQRAAVLRRSSARLSLRKP